MGDLLTALADHANTDSTHTHLGNLGFTTGGPVQATEYIAAKATYNNLKSDPVNNEDMLSDISFTEK